MKTCYLIPQFLAGWMTSDSLLKGMLFTHTSTKWQAGVTNELFNVKRTVILKTGRTGKKKYISFKYV